MKPLTLECARVRQLLNAHYDGELKGDEEAYVTSHLATCEGCEEAWNELQSALAALSTLTPEDLARLRGLPIDGDYDTRPLSHGVLAGVLLLLLAVTGTALVANSRSSNSIPKANVVPLSVPLPAVGGDVGVERDASHPPAPKPMGVVAQAQAAPPTSDLLPDDTLLAMLPRVSPTLVMAAAPKPKKKVARPKAKPAVVRRELADPLPERALAYLERLRFSQGLSYRDVVFFFLQDPEGRDRLASTRGPALPQIREGSPANPETCVARPPRGRSRTTVLVGELLDAPLGLRIARATVPVTARTPLAVDAVAWDGLGRRRSHDAVLKAPVLLPSEARYALLTKAEPNAVAVLLGQLTHNAFTEVQRLRLEANRLEPEARSLETRLRARVRNTRGLRGLAVSINGAPRSIDLFGNSRAFAAALPTLLRSALFESHLKFFGPDDDSADWAGTKILGGENATRPRQQALLRIAVASRKTPEPVASRKIDAVYASAPDAVDGVARVTLQGGNVLHAVVIAGGSGG